MTLRPRRSISSPPHYTSKERLASEGGSNGGLLVSTCYVQRPDLFGAVLCHVPVTDMLRYPRNLLLRYDTRAGHGGGKPITKVLDETADGYEFLAKVFGLRLSTTV